MKYAVAKKAKTGSGEFYFPTVCVFDSLGSAKEFAESKNKQYAGSFLRHTAEVILYDDVRTKVGVFSVVNQDDF